MQKYIFNMKDILTYQVKKIVYLFFPSHHAIDRAWCLWYDPIFVENCVCVCVCVCCVSGFVSLCTMGIWGQIIICYRGCPVLQNIQMHSWHLPTRCKQQHHHNTSPPPMHTPWPFQLLQPKMSADLVKSLKLRTADIIG